VRGLDSALADRADRPTTLHGHRGSHLRASSLPWRLARPPNGLLAQWQTELRGRGAGFFFSRSPSCAMPIRSRACSMIRSRPNLAQASSPQGPQVRGFGLRPRRQLRTLSGLPRQMCPRHQTAASPAAMRSARRSSSSSSAFDSESRAGRLSASHPCATTTPRGRPAHRSDDRARQGRVRLEDPRRQGHECDLIVKAEIGGRCAATCSAATGRFTPDDGSARSPTASCAAPRRHSAGQELPTRPCRPARARASA